ncbi:HTH-type transcriptional repressor GlcR [Vibrio marisflavi CECT 7928]|uniref:HTH-type transcriptional repressor GlcR n=2 Tax=Vibrio marisflavi TaxID=1216040 RepID=A0ABM8ZZW0_9VIBR|nr:HTH-type transcriptional repressor GlcR [Vibrio marisflavi CECT 7928]
MTQEERLLSMQQWLLEVKKITLADVCERYEISRDSARRDLVKLTQIQGIERVRGGAISVPVTGHVTAYRDKPLSLDKQEIGRVAASLVEPNDFISIDTGTTLSAMACYMKLPATVVTNSIDVLSHLADESDIDVHFVGGKFNAFHRAMLGATAVAQLAQYQVNKTFIGVCAISESGLSTASEEEAALKQAMISQAEKVILVCEIGKFAQQHFFKVCQLEEVDVIVTNQAPPQDMINIIQSNDIELIVTDQLARTKV